MTIGGVKYDGSTGPTLLRLRRQLGRAMSSITVVDAILGALTQPDIGQLFPTPRAALLSGRDPARRSSWRRRTAG